MVAIEEELLRAAVEPDLAAKVAELERSGAPFEQIAPLASGRRLKAAFETGNLEDGVLTIGQVRALSMTSCPCRPSWIR